MAFLAALISILPGVLWLILFYRSDRFDPEPKKLVARTFMVGAIVAAAMALVYQGLPFVASMVTMAIFVAPVVEESAKFLIVRWTVYHRKEFDEPIDGIVYAAAAALGFASVENIVYVLSEWYNGGPVSGFMVLTARAVLSVPAHALFATFWGAALGWSKGRKGIKPVIRIFLGLLAAMVLHGLFNFLSNSTILGGLGFLIMVAVVWRIVFLIIKRALDASPFSDRDQSGEQD